MKPVRHSSWAMAGIPSREVATTWRCRVRRCSTPSAAEIGALPKARVMCPSPWAIAASKVERSSAKADSMGAAPPVASSGSGRSQ